jgi:DNA polymerase IV
VREIPGVGKVMENHLHELGIKKVGDLARLEEAELEQRFGKWGLALAGKARGEDAGGWFDTEVGADIAAKSISHEHTYNEDTADANQLEATLMRLSEMVGRRLREAKLSRAHNSTQAALPRLQHDHAGAYLSGGTQLDGEIFEQVRALFRKNWKQGREVRLLGVQASTFEAQAEQISLLEGGRQKRWKDALAAADRLRDKFGESSVSLASRHARKLSASGRRRIRPGCRERRNNLAGRDPSTSQDCPSDHPARLRTTRSWAAIAVAAKTKAGYPGR